MQSSCPDEYTQDLLKRAVSWKILEQIYLQAVTRDTYLNLCDSVCDMGWAQELFLINSQGSPWYYQGPYMLSSSSASGSSMPMDFGATNTMGRGCNGTIVRGLAISHASAHSHALMTLLFSCWFHCSSDCKTIQQQSSVTNKEEAITISSNLKVSLSDIIVVEDFVTAILSWLCANSVFALDIMFNACGKKAFVCGADLLSVFGAYIQVQGNDMPKVPSDSYSTHFLDIDCMLSHILIHCMLIIAADRC